MYKKLPFLFILIATSCIQKKEASDPTDRVSEYIDLYTDSLFTHVTRMLTNAETEKFDRLQNDFKDARRYYKMLEPVTEFYFQGLSKAINGPAIDKPEEYDDKVIEATGFQVVEELLFPEPDTLAKEEIVEELALLVGLVNRMKELNSNNQLTNENIFEAVRLHVLRIMSLGISGFDSPIALHSIPEANTSLEAIKQILLPYGEHSEKAFYVLKNDLHKAQKYLSLHTNFNDFDRAEFIIQYLTPIAESSFTFQQELGISNNRWLTAVNLDKKNFVEKDVFQVAYFAPSVEYNATPELTELGRILFFDPILSGNNRRACASCHRPTAAFTDSRPKSIAFDFEGTVTRNAPTLINAGFQRSLFWDQRVQFLEDQVANVISNSNEMHGSMREAVHRIKKSEEYRQLFAKAFDSEKGGAVSERNIRIALAWYVRSLNGLNARFDKYLRGESIEVTTEEIRGFNLFMGKAKCGTCHFFPLFNGSVPPMYNETESEVLGIPVNPDTVGATIDSDPGKFLTYHRELHRHAFKTPTIRNATLTAPYMHNGVFSSLEDVMDFYNRGGGAGMGIDVPNQTLPPDALNLSSHEQQLIIKFIQSLTDTTGTTITPKRLPSFNKPDLNKRMIGGEY